MKSDLFKNGLLYEILHIPFDKLASLEHGTKNSQRRLYFA
jgi:hypothetical protein